MPPTKVIHGHSQGQGQVVKTDAIYICLTQRICIPNMNTEPCIVQVVVKV